MREVLLLVLLTILLVCLPRAGIAMSYDSKQLSSINSAQPIMLLSEQVAGIHSADDIGHAPKARWNMLPVDNGKFTMPEGVSWLKVKLANDSNHTKNFYLTLKNHFQMESVDFYNQLNNFELNSTNEVLSQANFYYGNIQVVPHGKYTLYMRVKTDSAITNSIKIMERPGFEQFLAEQEFYNGVAIGGILFLSIVFWVLFVATGEKLLGILASYFTLRTIFLTVFLGANLFYLYDQNTDVRGFELPILSALSSYCFLWFVSTLFHLRVSFPRLHRLTLIVRWITLAYIPIGLLLTVDANLMLTAGLMAAVMLYLLGVGVYLARQKKILANVFSAVMLLQLMFTVALALGGFFQVEIFSEREPLQIASFWLNALLVVYVISRLYFYQMKDKQRVQLEALEHAVASQQAQQDLIKLQKESQEELEHRVQERTLELNIALNELEEVNQELEQKNTIDVLTDLYNRRFYDQKITAEYRRSKRNLTKLSIILIDVDYFKKVNDQYGHLAGDQCLHWVAQIIKQSIKRSTDMAFRYGGEEFILILPDTEMTGALALAESIRNAIDTDQFSYQQQHIPLTISCGVSTYTQQKNALVEDLFLAADGALYQAKNGGRNQVKYQDICAEPSTQELK
ncbi:diguanylate cyclase [Thalassotalea atypica]|uniref:diguanylate cyclase n=1 Tax=Thalassotalea atypica TaxID=2054316 RepID=UPI0025729F39|nr:diguanylate cyclase [Thalassotalea atypica]